MKKLNIVIVVLVMLLSITTVILSAQSDNGASSRDITIKVDEDLETSVDYEIDRANDIDISIQVKRAEERYYKDVILKYYEEDKFYDMPYSLSQNDKFKILVKSNIEEDLYLYLLNVTPPPKSELVNIFEKYNLYIDVRLINGYDIVELPKERLSFTFDGNTGADIMIMVSSRNKLLDKEINQLFDIKEYKKISDNQNNANNANSRDIVIKPDNDDENTDKQQNDDDIMMSYDERIEFILENGIQIYGAYIYSE
jgi:hypothetical protein